MPHPDAASAFAGTGCDGAVAQYGLVNAVMPLETTLIVLTPVPMSISTIVCPGNVP